MEKKVLIIGIGFYDYEKSIIDQFEKLNYNVDYFCEVPQNTILYRFYIRVNNSQKLEHARSIVSDRIANDCAENYDFVFIIKCECLTIKAIKKIKLKNPKAKFVLYLWDSIIRIPNIIEKFVFFDDIYSFDRLDCLSNNHLKFNPLFMRDEYVNIEQRHFENIFFDIYHLGWYHSDRLALVSKIAKICKQNGLRYKMLLFTGYFSYLYQMIFGGELRGNKKFLIFKVLSAKENQNNILRSTAVLDIAHKSQSGLTMRTIEQLGLKHKIITTNQDIVNYNFFHPNNVLIIDRDNPVIDKSFFESEYYPIEDEIIAGYSISNWIKRMIN